MQDKVIITSIGRYRQSGSRNIYEKLQEVCKKNMYVNPGSSYYTLAFRKETIANKTCLPFLTGQNLSFRTPKVNVCCAISKNRPKGLFFFRRKLTGNVYQQIIQNWLYDELIVNEQEHFIFKQDGTPPHW